MGGSLGSIQVGATCGIRSVKVGLLLLPGEKEGRHSSTNTHQSWFSHILALLYHFLFPLKPRERGLVVFMPLFAAFKNVCNAYRESQLVDFGLG